MRPMISINEFGFKNDILKLKFSPKELAELCCLKYLSKNNSEGAIASWMCIHSEKKQAQQAAINTHESLAQEKKLSVNLVTNYSRLKALINTEPYLAYSEIQKGIAHILQNLKNSNYYWLYYFCINLLQLEQGADYLSELIKNLPIKAQQLLFYRLVTLISLRTKKGEGLISEKHVDQGINTVICFLLQQEKASQTFIDWIKSEGFKFIGFKELHCFFEGYAHLKEAKIINCSFNFDHNPFCHAIFLSTLEFMRNEAVQLTSAEAKFELNYLINLPQQFRLNVHEFAWNFPEVVEESALIKIEEKSQPFYSWLSHKSEISLLNNSHFYTGILLEEFKQDALGAKKAIILYDYLHSELGLSAKQLDQWREKVLESKNPTSIIKMYCRALNVITSLENILKIQKLQDCNILFRRINRKIAANERTWDTMLKTLKEIKEASDIDKKIESNIEIFIETYVFCENIKNKKINPIELCLPEPALQITGFSRFVQAKNWCQAWLQDQTAINAMIDDFNLLKEFYILLFWVEHLLSRSNLQIKTYLGKQLFAALPDKLKARLFDSLFNELGVTELAFVQLHSINFEKFEIDDQKKILKKLIISKDSYSFFVFLCRMIKQAVYDPEKPALLIKFLTENKDFSFHDEIIKVIGQLKIVVPIEQLLLLKVWLLKSQEYKFSQFFNVYNLIKQKNEPYDVLSLLLDSHFYHDEKVIKMLYSDFISNEDFKIDNDHRLILTQNSIHYVYGQIFKLENGQWGQYKKLISYLAKIFLENGKFNKVFQLALLKLLVLQLQPFKDPSNIENTNRYSAIFQIIFKNIINDNIQIFLQLIKEYSKVEVFLDFIGNEHTFDPIAICALQYIEEKTVNPELQKLQLTHLFGFFYKKTLSNVINFQEKFCLKYLPEVKYRDFKVVNIISKNYYKEPLTEFFKAFISGYRCSNNIEFFEYITSYMMTLREKLKLSEEIFLKTVAEIDRLRKVFKFTYCEWEICLTNEYVVQPNLLKRMIKVTKNLDYLSQELTHIFEDKVRVATSLDISGIEIYFKEILNIIYKSYQRFFGLNLLAQEPLLKNQLIDVMCDTLIKNYLIKGLVSFCSYLFKLLNKIASSEIAIGYQSPEVNTADFLLNIFFPRLVFFSYQNNYTNGLQEQFLIYFLFNPNKKFILTQITNSKLLTLCYSVLCPKDIVLIAETKKDVLTRLREGVQHLPDIKLCDGFKPNRSVYMLTMMVYWPDNELKGFDFDLLKHIFKKDKTDLVSVLFKFCNSQAISQDENIKLTKLIANLLKDEKSPLGRLLPYQQSKISNETELNSDIFKKLLKLEGSLVKIIFEALQKTPGLIENFLMDFKKTALFVLEFKGQNGLEKTYCLACLKLVESVLNNPTLFQRYFGNKIFVSDHFQNSYTALLTESLVVNSSTASGSAPSQNGLTLKSLLSS